jgi:DNA-binding transcriptional ArsR family regulator
MSEKELIPEGLMVRVTERLRILGQPVRLRLIELLTDGPSTPQELSDALGLSQQTVSKHLFSLHRGGVDVVRAYLSYSENTGLRFATLQRRVKAIKWWHRQRMRRSYAATPTSR